MTGKVTLAFLEEGFNGDGQIPAPSVIEAMRQRRTGVVLRYSAGIMAAAIVFTLTGLVATLWHMSRWIAVGFCLMVVVSLFVTILALAASQPPDSQEERQEGDAQKVMAGSVDEPGQHD